MTSGRVAETRDERIEIILDEIPHGFLRSGTAMIGITVAVLLGVGWFVRYPDVVRSRVFVSTAEPPVRLVAPSPGRVERVLVSEGSAVGPGDYLAVLQSTTNLDDVRQLHSWVNRVRVSLSDPAQSLPDSGPSNLNLGDLQSSYAECLAALAEYRVAAERTYDREQVARLRAQIREYQRLGTLLQQQESNARAQADLDRNELARRETLAQRNFATSVEVDQARSRVLQGEYSIQNSARALRENQIRILEQQAALATLERGTDDSRRRAASSLRAVTEALEGRIANWENVYVIRAPIRGRVSLLFPDLRNRFVAPPQQLLAVIPAGGGVVATMNISATGASTVKPEQSVRIVLDGYPAAEWGTLGGRVRTVSPVSRDSLYSVVIALPNRLVTSSGRIVQSKPDMQGTGEIVTRDMRLLTRIFQRFYDAVTSSG